MRPNLDKIHSGPSLLEKGDDAGVIPKIAKDDIMWIQRI
jgi:hypothetical protein